MKKGRVHSINKLKKELKIKEHCHYNISTDQFGKVLSVKEYKDFLALRPMRHPLHKMLLVYAENGVERVVDSLTMTELCHFVKRGYKYIDVTLDKSELEFNEYIHIRYDFRELPLHRIVSEAYYNRTKTELESTHHIDFNKHNNQASNLVFMNHNGHLILHKLNRK